jgi:transposase
MRFYTQQHQYYCGIDLHARKMYVCIFNNLGKIVLHKNIKTDPEIFFEIIFPFLPEIVVGVECMFSWYWVADLCNEHRIPFILGHALYMKAIHGGKTKNDKIDSRKIAALIRGGNFPLAYAYPQKMRSTRDLLRRRMHLMRKRSELLAHIHNTNTQYNLPVIGKKIAYKTNRNGIAERFEDPSVNKSIQIDLAMIDTYDKLLQDVELYILKHAKAHDANTLYLLQTVPGVGKILALVMLYEIHDIGRFPLVQDFSSYSRLIRPEKESNGKKAGKGNKKIGNPHLKWAFSEATILLLRESEQAKKLHQKLVKKNGEGKALGILSNKLGRAVYYMLKNKKAFDMDKFFSH